MQITVFQVERVLEEEQIALDGELGLDVELPDHQNAYNAHHQHRQHKEEEIDKGDWEKSQEGRDHCYSRPLVGSYIHMIGYRRHQPPPISSGAASGAGCWARKLTRQPLR
jgi:hypothetical protein